MPSRPLIANIGVNVSYGRDDGSVLLAPDLVISDADSSTLAHATVRLRVDYSQPFGDLLTANVSGTSIVQRFDAADGMLTLSGTDTVEHYEQVLRTVRYSWSGDAAERPTVSRAVEWQADDGSASLAFGAAMPITAAGFGRVDVVLAADVNGDGRDDLLTTDGTPRLLINRGDGTFNGPIPMWFMPDSVADINGDGRLDLVTAAVEAGTRVVKTALGNGDGSFRTPASHSADWLGLGQLTAAADMNRDGNVDIVTARSILLGNGDGTFSAAQLIASDASVHSVAVADVDGDGRADLILKHADNSGSFTVFYVAVWKGNGDGTLQSPSRSNLPARLNDGNMSVADFDADGNVDLVVTSTVDSTLGVLLGRGDGTFDPALVHSGITRPLRTAIDDLNGDGLPDIIIAGGNPGFEDSVRVMLGGTSSYLLFHTGVSAGSSPRRLAIGDFDGLGGLDLAVVGLGRTSSEYGFTVVLNASMNLSDPVTSAITLDWGPRVYAWSALAGGQSLPFDASRDRLVFDDTSISAASLSLQGPLLQVSHLEKTVTFETQLRTATTTNVTFLDGSVLRVGDEAVAMTQDDAANALTGGAGDDQLFGAGGDDTLTGGGGADLLVGGGGGDVMNGNEGNDTASYAGSDARVFARLWVGDAWNGDGGRQGGNADLLVAIENLVGSEHADWFEASDVVGSMLDGRAGLDTLFGRGQDDRLIGGAGDDMLFGGAGDDVLIGGAGADMIDGGDGTGDIASYAGAPDRVFARLWVNDAWGADTSNGQGGSDTLVRVEGLRGSDNADWLEGLLDTRSTLIGAGGEDALFGFAGDDVLSGGDGTDWLRGGAGGDALDGGPGIDTVSYEGSDARVFARLWVGDAWNGHGWRGRGDADVLTSIENLVGSDHADSFEGDAVSNRLEGGAGMDSLFGREGDDVLIGGAGDDWLQGGAGADTFIYRAASEGIDTIQDFERGAGHDRLLLDHVLVGYVHGLSSLANFVSLRESPEGTALAVNTDGAGSDFVDVLVLQGQSGLTLNSLLADGNLVIA